MMNRGDLILMTAHHARVSVDTTDKVVGALLECLTLALAAGEAVHLKKFGNFELRNRDPVTRINPRSGEPMEIGARTHVSFLAGDTLRTRLNPTVEE